MPKIIPEPLHPGDEVRVVAPSTGIKIIGADSREIAASRFAEMGLKVSFGANTTDENFDMMGTSSIKKRADDINAAFSDPKVKAIFTIIGGFNSNQLLPFLDYDLIKKNPKIFCGFSDITALLNGIYAKTNMVTFLGPHYSSFGMKYGFDYSFAAIKQMLMGEGKLDVEPSAEWSDDLWFIDQEKREFIKNEGWWQIRAGEACGTLMGGNLGTLTLLLGSPYWPGFKPNTILLVEDCFTSAGDPKEFLRNLQALAYQPDFGNVKALLIGRFQKASGMTRELLEYIIHSIPQLDSLPVIANLDFGHSVPNLTLPIGGTAKISSNGQLIQISRDERFLTY